MGFLSRHLPRDFYGDSPRIFLWCCRGHFVIFFSWDSSLVIFKDYFRCFSQNFFMSSSRDFFHTGDIPAISSSIFSGVVHQIFSSSFSPEISSRSFPCIAPRVPHGISTKVPPVISLTLVRHAERTLHQRGKSNFTLPSSGIFVKSSRMISVCSEISVEITPRTSISNVVSCDVSHSI